MRILVAVPLTGISPEGLVEREQKIKEVLGDVEVDLWVIPEGPLSIESKSEEMVAAYQLLNMLKDVHTIEDTYDGLLVWCAGDPGVEALRELYNIPVVGPGQAMISVANIISSKFGIVCPSCGDAEMIMNLFYHLGLDQRLVAKEALGISVLDLKKDPNKVIEMVSRTAKEMMDKHNIESLLLGCMGFFDIGKEVERIIEIPVVDPGVVGLHMLKMMIQANVVHSKRKYPPLRKGKLF